jgi:hypothetical protein
VFKQLPGSRDAKADQMFQEITRVYGRLATEQFGSLGHHGGLQFSRECLSLIDPFQRKGTLDADRYQALGGKLEYFDLRDLQQAITSASLWPKFESRFSTKEALNAKFDQLAELRNGIRHSRAVSAVVRKEGEAAILWFEKVLSK